MKKIAEFRKSGNMNLWWIKINETVIAVNELIDAFSDIYDNFKALEKGASDLDKAVKDNPEQLELLKGKEKDEVDILIEKGDIRKKGSWYYLSDGTKFLGKKKLLEHLKEEKE